jgi:ACS family glucarate transporter-like MFS transporter
MLSGIYLGQFCINVLTYFFITWFPIYLVQARHMSILHSGLAAALSALCGSAGSVLGGITSDSLLRHGYSLTFSRKAPIIAGMLVSVTMIACNYTNAQTLVMFFMSVAFFGKAFGALGWTVIADTSPKELVGLNGGLFNLFGNIAGIITPIVIGYLVKKTGSFNDALVFVGAAALLAIFSYVVIVGEIKRLELQPLSPVTRGTSHA